MLFKMHLSMCPLYTLIVLPLFSPITPLPLHLWLLSVCYFNGYILLAYLFCWLGSTSGEITWYLSFTSWLISFSIIFSSSIHAVVKGRNSFFFFLMHGIPSCKCTIDFWSTHLLMGIGVASSTWLLKIVLLWPLGCIGSFELVFQDS